MYGAKQCSCMHKKDVSLYMCGKILLQVATCYFDWQWERQAHNKTLQKMSR